MRDIIEQALKGHDADYVEVHIEEGESTHISYRGRELEDIGRSRSRGGNVRALVNGGWGFVSFNDSSNLRERVALAVRQARLVGREQSALAPVEPVVDTVALVLAKDPPQVPLADKKLHPDDVNELLWCPVPEMKAITARLGDSGRAVWRSVEARRSVFFQG